MDLLPLIRERVHRKVTKIEAKAGFPHSPSPVFWQLVLQTPSLPISSSIPSPCCWLKTASPPTPPPPRDLSLQTLKASRLSKTLSFSSQSACLSNVLLSLQSCFSPPPMATAVPIPTQPPFLDPIRERKSTAESAQFHFPFSRPKI